MLQTVELRHNTKFSTYPHLYVSYLTDNYMLIFLENLVLCLSSTVCSINRILIYSLIQPNIYGPGLTNNICRISFFYISKIWMHKYVTYVFTNYSLQLLNYAYHNNTLRIYLYRKMYKSHITHLYSLKKSWVSPVKSLILNMPYTYSVPDVITAGT